MDLDRFVIFLDIDGVLTSYLNLNKENDGKTVFHYHAVSSLNKIIEHYNADLCMISSWNFDFKDADHYKTFLESRDIIMNNLTIGDQNNRSTFIKEKIKEGLREYLIIDDEAYEYYNSMPDIEYKRILQTNRYETLNYFDFLNVTVNWKLNKL